jgi:hypothetical protein
VHCSLHQKGKKNSAPMERPNGQNKKNIKVRIQKKKEKITEYTIF